MNHMANGLFQSLHRNADHTLDVLKFRLGLSRLSPTRFVIFGRGRSGTSVLVNLLNSLPSVRCDGEILKAGVLFPFSHVLAKCADSRSSIYGCKILSYQIKQVQPISDKEGFVRRLYDNGFKILYLKRENLVNHALSNIRARKYGFHKRGSQKLHHDKVTVDTDELLTWIRSSEMLDHYESLLLKDVPHLPLTYEKHLLDQVDHPATIELICEYLGIENGETRTDYRKVSPRRLRDSVANYEQVVDALRGTPYAKYLD